MIYEFTFLEKQHGYIKIESDTPPTEQDVINLILDGYAFFGDVEYDNIKLYNIARSNTDHDRDQSR